MWVHSVRGQTVKNKRRLWFFDTKHFKKIQNSIAAVSSLLIPASLSLPPTRTHTHTHTHTHPAAPQQSPSSLLSLTCPGLLSHARVRFLNERVVSTRQLQVLRGCDHVHGNDIITSCFHVCMCKKASQLKIHSSWNLCDIRCVCECPPLRNNTDQILPWVHSKDWTLGGGFQRDGMTVC